MANGAATRSGGRGLWATALVVWAVLLGAVAVRAVAQPGAHDCYQPFYEPAGRNWLRGVDLYQDTTATCRYSPLANALLAAPALAPTPVGGLLWRALNAAAFLGGLLWWTHAVAPPTWTARQRAFVLLFVVPMALPTISCAQANPLLTGLVLAGTAAACRGRWNWAAALVAGACLLKVYPVALALLLAVAFPRRFLPRFLVALAAGLALPFVLQNPWWVARQYGNWWTNLCVDDRTQWPVDKGYRDLWLLIRFYRLPVSYHGYVVVQLAVAAMTAVAAVAARWRTGHPDGFVFNTVMGMAACWMTVCGPATEGGGYILVAPTLAWALLEVWRPGRPVWVRGLVTGSCACFAAGVASALGPNAGALMAYGWHPMGGLLLLIALMGDGFRGSAPPAGSIPDAAPTAPARAA